MSAAGKVVAKFIEETFQHTLEYFLGEIDERYGSALLYFTIGTFFFAVYFIRKKYLKPRFWPHASRHTDWGFTWEFIYFGCLIYSAMRVSPYNIFEIILFLLGFGVFAYAFYTRFTLETPITRQTIFNYRDENIRTVWLLGVMYLLILTIAIGFTIGDIQREGWIWLFTEPKHS